MRVLIKSIVLVAIFNAPELASGRPDILCQSFFRDGRPPRAQLPTVIEVDWIRLDDYHRFDLSHYRRALVLSDGSRQLGVEIRRAGGVQDLVVVSDFVPRAGLNAVIDNNALPFAAESFDFIVLNRGLCFCPHVVESAVARRQRLRCCGGIETEEGAMTSFMESVIATLRGGRESLALLTGYGYYHADLSIVWPLLLRSFVARHPDVQFAALTSRRLVSVTNPLGFAGIAISKSDSVPISDAVLRVTNLSGANDR